MHHRRHHGHEQDVVEAGADHDIGAHSQDVEHRRDQDEAAAHAHQHGQRADDNAQQKRGERRDVEARAIEAPASGQRGDQRMMTATARCGGIRIAAQRLPRLARHQRPDRTQEHDVERVDDHVDLADRTEEAEQQRSDARPDPAACDHDRAHAVIDAVALGMRQHARHAGSGDLSGSGRGGHGWRHPVEYQQRCRQKPAAHAEQARKYARDPAQQHDPEPVDGQVRDGEVDVHPPALSQGRRALKYAVSKSGRKRHRRARSRLRIARDPKPVVCGQPDRRSAKA